MSRAQQLLGSPNDYHAMLLVSTLMQIRSMLPPRSFVSWPRCNVELGKEGRGLELLESKREWDMVLILDCSLSIEYQ
jgi:hypothetical protein